MEEQRRQEKEAGGAAAPPPTSPQVEEQSLQQTMDKNKESLKRKLMLRRSVTELVDQGIYPPLKTPPAYAEQRKQLERAKTGDLLRHKIQQRPDRQALIQQHILEASDSKVAPSLQDRQRQLKRARLQDSLSDRLANRPGPLELVEGNILQTDPDLKDAILEGKLTFTKTVENEDNHRSSRHFVFDDDSNTSDGAPSPQQGIMFMDGDQAMQISTTTAPGSGGGLSTTIPSPPDITPLLQKMQQSSAAPGRTFIFAQNMPPITSQSFTVSPTGSNNSIANTSGSRSSSSGSNSSTKIARLKKPKPKSTPKSKVIKFHEYKGPPNLVKSLQNQQGASASDTPYHILLQQQQLFLQWQLEFQQKNMPFILPPQLQKAAGEGQATAPTPPAPPLLPAASLSPPIAPTPPVAVLSETTPSPPSVVLTTATSTMSSATVTSSLSQQNKPATTKVTRSLEDMKVADLKAELKKRNLTVSGTKPQLIERLKPYSDVIINSSPPPTSSSNSGSTSGSEISVTSPPSVHSLSGLINIQPVTPQSVAPSEESVSMTMGSPPVSPASSINDLNMSHGSVGPISPDTNMDTMIASPPMFTLSNQQVTKNKLNLSQGAVPMAVDQQVSRPPSVAPMDVDLSGSQSNLAAAFAASMASTTVDQNQNPQFHNAIPAAQLVSIQLPVQTQTQVGQPQVISQEELVRQQQKQIEELQRQLQQSQLRLKEAHQQSQQQQQLKFTFAQQKPAPTSISATPLTTNNAKVSRAPAAKQPVVAQIQIQPVAAQQQPTPAVSVAASTVPTSTTSSTMDIKQNMLANLLQIRALQHGINMTQQKVFQFTTAAPNAQSFIFTAPQQKQPQQQQQQQQEVDVSAVAPIDIKPKVATLPVNGINTTSRASSVPTSPVGHNKLHRSATNPFFTNVPHNKEPPKYDEAIKNKQNVSAQPQGNETDGCKPLQKATAGGALSTKSQVMDDVLEILIRHGELPPSAAQEPPPTPKTEPQPAAASMASTASVLSSATSVPMATSTILAPATSSMQFVNPGVFASVAPTFTTSSQATPVTTAMPQNTSPLYVVPPGVASPEGALSPASCLSPLGVLTMASIPSPLGALSPVRTPSPAGSIERKDPPPPLSLDSNISTSVSSNNDFGCLTDQFQTNMADLPFITMDWSDSDTNMNNLDLPDMLDTPDPLGLSKNRTNAQDMLDLPSSLGYSRSGGSIHGSEPNLNMLELNDTDIMEDSSAMNSDVSDWLDVIMPSTGLTPLSANAPVSFSCDPILTPKPQDVLDLFNMEESDLYTPTDLCSNMSFDKATEMSITKS